MIKPALLFLIAFVVSAFATLLVRTARHDPYVEPGQTSQISNLDSKPEAPATPHANHASKSETSPGNASSDAGPKSEISNLKSDAAADDDDAAAPVVNTVCALCGMPVDPSIKPAEYQGKLIGFGCRACPPVFAKDPNRYGPSALRNEVVE